MTRPPAEVDRDEQLALILQSLLDESRDGRQADIEIACAEHPHLADELRSLWALAAIAEDFGSVALEPTVISDDSSQTAALTERIGDYELLEEIGRGGMGVVFKARQKGLNRVVALKMILRGQLASETDVARFRAEAEAAARINRPNIVPVYEVGEHKGQPYFSMKYVEGTTLARRIADGPLGSHEAAELLLPICRAIADAHRQGVLHRDLKPSNILIDHEDRPYVSDFGLAKRLPEATFAPDRDGVDLAATLTDTGAILGTPGYMAPEQAAGPRGEVSAATDVYSLGALLYAMLTGRAPFQAASPVDTVLMVLEQDPPPPRVLNPRADPDLEMVALKCLQKPADLRYASADDLADDLEAYLHNEPIAARSSKVSQVISRVFREKHHAVVLENWGLLWMWHSLVLGGLCVVTNAVQFWFERDSIDWRWPYVLLWGLGLTIWAGIFWNLRRRAGPITFVERQIAHLWAGSMIASTLLYAVEYLLDLPVLALSPVLGLVTGMVFLTKAGILSGAFYVQAAALFFTGVVMALIPALDWPNIGLTIFGGVSAACFFFPGLKYYRQRLQGDHP